MQENALLQQKKCKNIWSIQKKIVILQAFSREHMRGGVQTIIINRCVGQCRMA